MDKLSGRGGGGTFLAWPTTAASPQITMEIHISDWTHKFQNKTGLDAKANSELYKSNRVNSEVLYMIKLTAYNDRRVPLWNVISFSKY